MMKSLRWLGLLIGTSLVSAVETRDLVPLTTSFPEPLYDPSNVKGGHIDIKNFDRKLKQPPLLVPRGLKNLALGKPVESIDTAASEEALSRVTDGKKVAMLELSLTSTKQWIQIDLEDIVEIHGIWVWHRPMNMRAYVDVVVQVSHDQDLADGEEITLYNSDHDNSSGLGRGHDQIYVETHRGRVIAGNGVKGRYVRLYSNGSTSNELNHYVEVEVWGRK